MEIGIISMQRVPNYGSFLQSYGLKAILENLGHEVCFIDYEEGKPIVPYSRKDWFKYKVLNTAGIKAVNDWIKYNVLGKREFVYDYRMHYLQELGIGYAKRNKSVDVVIIGSDEVFNCMQSGFNVGFSPMLFGQGIHAKKIISYAASFGYTDIQALEKYGVKNLLAGYFDVFSDVSVRDDNSKQIVEQLTGKEPELHLDPVFIADFDIPDVDVPYEDFVILYTYKSRIYSEAERTLIRNFCRNNNKILLSVGNAQNWVDVHVHATPIELLAYIKAADFIITDTFHGSVFSMKYNKSFVTLIRDDNRYKLTDLLKRMKQSDRVIESFQSLQYMYGKQIDFTKTNTVIAREKKYTMDYLHKNLG